MLKDQVGKAARRLALESPSDVLTCAIVEAELSHGAAKYGAPARRRGALEGFLAPFPFDSRCVPHYARLRDALERTGQVIGGNDLLIAASALTHDLTVVTHNGRVQSRARLAGRRLVGVKISPSC